MNKVEALLRIIGKINTAVNPKRAAAQKSEMIFPQTYANPNTTLNRTFSTSPDFPVSTTRESGTIGNVLRPVETRFTQMLLPFGTRQAKLNAKRQGKITQSTNMMVPLERTNRNINMTIGAIPPSLLALYLLANEDEE
jgi:hypothetical protein